MRGKGHHKILGVGTASSSYANVNNYLLVKHESNSHSVLPSVQVHDEVSRLGISVLDLALVAVRICAEFVRVEGEVRCFLPRLRGYRHLGAQRGHQRRQWPHHTVLTR